MKYKTLPSKEELQNLFSYEPEGWLVWKRQLSGRGKVGSRAGSRDKQGHFMVCIRGERYSLHRLIWAYHYGGTGLEEYDINHTDGNTENNRVENLIFHIREEHIKEHISDRWEQKTYETEATGCTEVVETKGKFISRVCVEGKTYHLGEYETEVEAYAAGRGALAVLGKTDR